MILWKSCLVFRLTSFLTLFYFINLVLAVSKLVLRKGNILTVTSKTGIEVIKIFVITASLYLSLLQVIFSDISLINVILWTLLISVSESVVKIKARVGVFNNDRLIKQKEKVTFEKTTTNKTFNKV
jgi:hypothetical protein